MGDTGEQAAQAAGGSQAQAATTGSAQAAGTSSQGSEQQTGGTGPSPEILRAELEETRREAAAARKAKDALEKKLSEIETAKLSEEEKKTKRLAELEAQIAAHETDRRSWALRLEITQKAPQLGIDPGLAARLVEPSSIEWTEDGTPKNVEKVLRGLLETYPSLRPAAGAAGSSTGSPARPNGGPLTREMISRMGPDEINARWEEIQKFLGS